MKKNLLSLFSMAIAALYSITFVTSANAEVENNVQFFSIDEWSKNATKHDSPEKFAINAYKVFTTALTEMDKKYIQPIRFTGPVSAAIKALADMDNSIFANITENQIIILKDNQPIKTINYSFDDEPEQWAKNLTLAVTYMHELSPVLSKHSSEEIYQIVFKNMLTELDPYSKYLTRQESQQRKNQHHGAMGTNGIISAENNTSVKLLKNNIAILTISSFDTNTEEIVENILNSLPIIPTGIIIDLSDSNGGIVRQAYATADMFINSGTLFKVKGRASGASKTYTAEETILYNGPIVIIINENTKSASEAFTWAMIANKRATVIGTKSFGKGLTQTPILLPNQGEIMLSWAEIYDIDGKSLNKNGINPNIIIKGKTPDDQHKKAIDSAIKLLLKP